MHDAPSDDFFESWDKDARRLLGKPLAHCTVSDHLRLQQLLDEENTRRVANTDRARAAIAEAARCGCTTVSAPPVPDGRPDYGRASIVHGPDCLSRLP